MIRGKLLHRDHHLWNGLVPLCPSFHWKHCIAARRLLCNTAKACPESRGIATVSWVWRISIVMSVSSQTTQCTRSYSNLTRKRLIISSYLPTAAQSLRSAMSSVSTALEEHSEKLDNVFIKDHVIHSSKKAKPKPLHMICTDQVNKPFTKRDLCTGPPCKIRPLKTKVSWLIFRSI